MPYANLAIPPKLVQEAPPDELHPKHHGTHAVVANSPELAAELEDRYGRSGLCLKLQKPLKPDSDAERYEWQKSPIREATIIQNLFARHGIAPRVYDVAMVNGERLAQVTDYADGHGKRNPDKIFALMKRYGVYRVGRTAKENDSAVRKPWKWSGRLFVDFGRFRFKRPYVADLKARLMRYMKGEPEGEPKAYQGVAELGIPGIRDMAYRLEHMALDGTDFADKLVLDLGCNEGAFSREAFKQGARRVVGVDRKWAELCYETMNWLGFWNFDVYDLDMPQERGQIAKRSGIEQFDVVFALSVAKNMEGFHGWMADLVKPGGVFWWEGHNGNTKKMYHDALCEKFQEVEWLGFLRDDGSGRPLWRCRK